MSNLREAPPYCRTFAATLILVLGYLGIAHAANPPVYFLTDLGTLGGTNSYGNGINASGQVTGSSTLADDTSTHAFIYSDGSMLDLGTLGGTYSVGSGINAAGQVAGFANIAGNTQTHAFLYSKGSMLDLVPADPVDGFSYAYGINDSGEVTGLAEQTAFLYSSGSLQILYALGGHSLGASINSIGQIAGNFSPNVTGSGGHAFLYSSGAAVDLGTLGGATSSGESVNTGGLVAGYSDTGNEDDNYAGPTHAFLYNGTAMLDLGTLGGSTSSGHAINASGEIAGSSDVTGDAASHAFLYSNGVMLDLNALDTSDSLAQYVTLTVATGINDESWIVANGTDSRTGQEHAYLLKPASTAAALLQDLYDLVVGVRGGKHLEHLVAEAQADYAAGDIRATSAVLEEFIHRVCEQSRRTLPPSLAKTLIADARAIQKLIESQSMHHREGAECCREYTD